MDVTTVLIENIIWLRTYLFKLKAKLNNIILRRLLILNITNSKITMSLLIIKLIFRVMSFRPDQLFETEIIYQLSGQNC